MSFGPAAIAWLRRVHGRTDRAFFVFTAIYAGTLFGFALYANKAVEANAHNSDMLIECFLDSVNLYRKIVPRAEQMPETTWSFGQIIPFMMLIYPMLLGLRAWMEGDVIGHVEEQMARTDTITTNISTQTPAAGIKFGAS